MRSNTHMDTTDDEPAGRQSWLVARGLLLERGPARHLAVASFVNMLGTSMFMLSAAVFYTKVVGLSVAAVGVGLGISAVIGLLAGVPVGHLADRRGPREVYLVTLILQAFTAAGVVFVSSFWSLVVLLSVAGLAQSASQAARGPIVRRFGGPKPARFRAYLRSAVNVASSVGALLAGLALQLDTHWIYVALILTNALSYVVSAAVISRLPHMAPVEVARGTAGKRRALTDRPFVAVTALEGVMAIQGKVLSFALPLWIVGHTSAPRWFIGLSVLVSTVMVVALQVRASRGVEDNTSAARAWRRSGFAFLAGMTLMGLAGGLSTWIAALMILVGVVVHTVGELWQAAGSFELRYALAPEHAQGQYSGVFQMGSALAGVVAPSVLGLLCITWGTPGWLVMGCVFVAASLVLPPVVRWAERSRPQAAVAEAA